MSDLILTRVGDKDVFALKSGEKVDFDVITKWAQFYENRLTKKTLSIEETIELSDLISKVVDGTEHGVVTYDSWKATCRKLQKFMAERGYRVWGRAFE